MKKQATVAFALLVSTLGSVGFVVAYATGGDRLYEGLCLAIAAAGLSAAALGWAFFFVADEIVVDEIETYPSSPGERAAQSGEIAEDVGKVSRPKLLVRLLYFALGAFGAALVVPVRSLGRAPDGALFTTRWRKGDRLVRDDGSPIYVGDLNVDSTLTVFPEGALDDSQSQATLIRLAQTAADSANGYIAYSRICTHAGCPVALYRAAAKELMCPCHQSVFDVLSNGAVVSGPADHALPRLPIEVGSDGILRATGDFPEPVGPGFWERG
jgi:ubiquinol-cytochrome c reductase iron-sulfur subunit